MEQFEDIKKYENKEELGLVGVETLSDLIGNMEELESIGISRMCELIYSRQSGMKEDDIKSKVSYSSYKTKLNKMFYGLFDKGYKEVLNGDKNKNEYKIYKNGKIFIFFCLIHLKIKA